VREILDRYDRLEHRLASWESELSGEVAVIAIYSAGIDLLNEVQAAFESRHPQVRVQVAYAHHERIYQSVRGGRADLGILSFPAQSRDLTIVPLRDEEMVVVTRGGHALVRRHGPGPIEAGELAGVPMAAFEPALPVARHIRRYFKDHGVSPRIASTFDNVDTIKSAVEVTDHAALLPRRTVLREVAAGTLAAIELHPPLTRPMGIVRRRGNGSGGPSRAAQALIDFLLRHTGSHGDMMTATALSAGGI
jgi:DNA-binding transcriptional LysR family regulator